MGAWKEISLNKVDPEGARQHAERINTNLDEVLLELIHNEMGARARNIEVKFYNNGTADCVRVRGDGCGIKDVQNALVYYKSSDNQYSMEGIGLKTAYNFCDSVNIQTKVHGDDFETVVHGNQFRKFNGKDKETQYTIIDLIGLKGFEDQTSPNLLNRLSIYFTYMNDAKGIIIIEDDIFGMPPTRVKEKDMGLGSPLYDSGKTLMGGRFAELPSDSTRHQVPNFTGAKEGYAHVRVVPGLRDEDCFWSIEINGLPILKDAGRILDFSAIPQQKSKNFNNVQVIVSLTVSKDDFRQLVGKNKTDINEASNLSSELKKFIHIIVNTIRSSSRKKRAPRDRNTDIYKAIKDKLDAGHYKVAVENITKALVDHAENSIVDPDDLKDCKTQITRAKKMMKYPFELQATQVTE